MLILTQRAYRGNGKLPWIILHKSLHVLARRNYDLFGDVSLIPITLDGVTSFFRIASKTYEIHVNAIIRVKFSRNGGKLETSEGYTCLFVASCV